VTDFTNFEDVIPLPMGGIEISPYYPEKNAHGQPTAVLVIATPHESIDDAVLSKLRFVMRFRTRKGMDAFIADLNRHADTVWGKRS
jgi:hypothetical protein